MTDATTGTESRSWRERLLRWGPAIVLLVAFVVVSIIVLPRVEADGSATLSSYELDAGQPVSRLRTRGAITRNLYGFVAGGFSSGTVAFDVTASPRPGERTKLLVSAGGGPDVATAVTLVDAARGRHLLGRPVQWVSHGVDVTSLVRGGRVRLEFAASNRRAAPQLVADRVQVATYVPAAIPRAGRWDVAAWIALGILLALVALRRARRDWLLVTAAALAALVVWPSIKSMALNPLFSDVWTASAGAHWFDLDHGLLSGTFGPRSALAVQLFHALTPLTGTGMAGARIASLLVGVLALAAIYALGRRVAGAVGAFAALTCALLADPFRLSLASGDSTGTLVLAACLFLIAVHRVLLDPDRIAMIALGVAGAVAILAEPLWWPGVLAAILLLALRYAPWGTRRAALGAALLALVLVTLPSRVSVAHQSGGDLNADVVERATTARNLEFVGRDHGAPADKAALALAPASGPPVGLGDYVLGDHSLSVVAGGALSGAYDGLSAAAERPETQIAGLLAFLVELVGVVYLLVLPRLRLLVIVPAMLAAVPWFFASRHATAPFQAGTSFWPALLVGAATVAYAAWELIRPRIDSLPFAAALREQAAALAQRGRRHPEPPEPAQP